MLTKNIADFKTKIQLHFVADLLVQGDYYDEDTGKGCFIGCLAHKDSPQYIQEFYGIPIEVTRLLEAIFEYLRPPHHEVFFVDIAHAMEDGKDLSTLVWKFLESELKEVRPLADEQNKPTIDYMISIMQLLIAGEPLPMGYSENAFEIQGVDYRHTYQKPLSIVRICADTINDLHCTLTDESDLLTDESDLVFYDVLVFASSHFTSYMTDAQKDVIEARTRKRIAAKLIELIKSA